MGFLLALNGWIMLLERLYGQKKPLYLFFPFTFSTLSVDMNGNSTHLSPL